MPPLFGECSHRIIPCGLDAGPTTLNGSEALAQIYEASRRSDSLPSFNYSHGPQKPYSGGASNFEAVSGQGFRGVEPWSSVGIRDSFHSHEGVEQPGFGHAFLPGHNAVRYQGH